MTVMAVLHPPVLELDCCSPMSPGVDFPMMASQLFLLIAAAAAAAATASLQELTVAISHHPRPWECRLFRRSPPCGNRRGSERP